ncbi:MAG: hypothetical protein IKJ58_02340 [Akkermansia sp.]|nr:hypothetical protein [Akkermansia sp.]
MPPTTDKNAVVLAFVYGILSVCTLGLWQGYLSQSKAAQVQPPRSRTVAMGASGILTDFQNVTQDIFRAVRKIASTHKA